MIPAWKKALIGLLLLIPLIVATIWMYYIQKTEQYYLGELLAPVDNGPILAVLSIFIVGYAVFLFALFHNNIRDYLLHKQA